jgi:hypothetical protein
MRIRFCRLVVVVLALAAGWNHLDRAAPQQPGQPSLQVPRLYQVLPTGGQAGTTFDVVVSGQDFQQAKDLLFSEPGITAESLGPTAPPAMDPKAKQQPKGFTNSHKFRVTVPARTRLGIHDVRVVTPAGVSNPRAFVVGDLKEFVEQEPNNNVDQMQRVQLNCTVSGVIAAPTDVDYFVFAGKKGQRVVVSCLTTSIDSKLPATIELYSTSGSYFGSNRNYRGNDALLDAELPADGDYYVRVGSFAYTLGGPDYFYRLTISTAPWIDAVYPPLVEPGTKATLTVYGRNLPGGKADPEAVVEGRTLEKMTTTVEVPKDARSVQRLDFPGYVPPVGTGLDGFEFRVHNAAGASNGVLLTFAEAPITLDNGDNDEPDKAQKLTLPCEVAGRIEKKGDRDWYTFAAKKGEVYSIEIYGDRLGSPVDMYFVLRTPDGKVLKEDDDNPAFLSPQLYTQSNDPPRYRFVVPADGMYQLLAASRFAFLQAGPRYQYRLRITPERPDFRVVAMSPAGIAPEAAVVRQGGHQVLSVYVWRQDGFTGNITLTGADLPPGVTVRPQIISTEQKQAIVVVSAAEDAKPWAGPIRLIATAQVQGKTLVREVRAATTTWPVPAPNVPAVSRLDRELTIAVRDRGPFSLSPAVEQVTVLVGDKIEVPLKLERFAKDFTATVQVTAVNLPQGLTMQPLNFTGGKETATASFAGGKLPPGSYTFVFRGQANVGAKADPKNPKLPAGALVLPSAPVTVTVLPKTLATVTLPTQQPTVKAGKQVELPIQVKRLYDYVGEFKVQLVLPPGTKGISADEMTIPAGQESGTLVLMAAPDATAGVRSNLTVRVTALVDGKLPVIHEKKLNVTVVK